MYFLLGLRKNDIGKKTGKKFSSKLSQKISVHILFQGKMQILPPRQPLQKNQVIRMNSYLREVFDRMLLLGGNFSDFILDFLLWWFLFLKFWVKSLVSRRSISHCLLCVPLYISTLEGLKSGVRWMKLIFALKLVFCLAETLKLFLKLF